jgi:hypothetical protein
MNTDSSEPAISSHGIAQSDRTVGRVFALVAAGWFLLLLLSPLFAG